MVRKVLGLDGFLTFREVTFDELDRVIAISAEPFSPRARGISSIWTEVAKLHQAWLLPTIHEADGVAS